MTKTGVKAAAVLLLSGASAACSSGGDAKPDSGGQACNAVANAESTDVISTSLSHGCDHWNCVKNFQTSPLVQVLAPSSPPPSTLPGVWPPSNAHHSTGYPGLQP